MKTSPNQTTSQQTQQSALYHLAKRKGFKLIKCRSRKRSDPEYGHYQISNSTTNQVVHMKGLNGYGLTLNDVAEYLRTH
jgi:hypothetical protein